jgi:antagonist of KipI
MALTIVRPGMFTTVQDCGRWGFQARGVSVSGAMDVFSHRLANALVGNGDDSATLEATLIGPEMQFQAASTVAITGAEFRVMLDGTSVAMNRAFTVPAGATLKFGDRLKGARAYVAVAGGIDVPPVLGSRATHVVSGMGGFQGRALRGGDALETGKTGSDPVTNFDIARRGSDPVFMLPDGGAALRVIAGPAGLGVLASRRYMVSPRSDRMGYRLDGSEAVEMASGEMISAPVPTGAVQVPPSGQPILLMSDHATTGGYAIAATVITADLPLAGQLAPGDWVEFQACSLEEADSALRDREAALGRA